MNTPNMGPLPLFDKKVLECEQICFIRSETDLINLKNVDSCQIEFSIPSQQAGQTGLMYSSPDLRCSSELETQNHPQHHTLSELPEHEEVNVFDSDFSVYSYSDKKKFFPEYFKDQSEYEINKQHEKIQRRYSYKAESKDATLQNDHMRGIKHDQCHYYERDPYILSNLLSNNFSESELRNVITKNKSVILKDCKQWNYDKSIMRETIVTKYNKVCDGQSTKAYVHLSYSLGCVVGCLLGGFLSDRFGRKVILFSFAILATLFAVLLPSTVDFISFLIIRFCLAVCNEASSVGGYVLCMELSGIKYRSMMGILLQIPSAIGYLLLAFLGHSTRSWPTVHYLTTALHSISLVFIYFVPESPRWLIVCDKFYEAEQIIRKACRYNKKSLPSGLELVRHSEKSQWVKDTERPTFLHLFQNRYFISDKMVNGCADVVRLLLRQSSPHDHFDEPLSSEYLEAFLDLECIEVTPAEVNLYQLLDSCLKECDRVLEDISGYGNGAQQFVKQGIICVDDDGTQMEVLEQVSVYIRKIKTYYEISNQLTNLIPTLLWELCSGPLPPNEQLKSMAALTNQFVRMINFVLQFDSKKMGTPAIQNDLSFYRRIISRTPFAEVKLVMNLEMANNVCLFLAASSPMLTSLVSSTTSFVLNHPDLPLINTTNTLASVVQICYRMVLHLRDGNNTDIAKQNFYYVSLVGGLLLHDHIHEEGAFSKNSHINIKSILSLLHSDQMDEEKRVFLFNTIRYNSKHLNDDKTPKSIRMLIS
uniref:CYRIA-B_Rac1-bd domain-containing protein n=1 Tax=Rhabditophanes sp. KR3021 TaxID=114890 RepID=A0AC35U002_9BILA